MSSVIVVSSLGQVFLAITQPYTGNRDGRPLWITGLASSLSDLSRGVEIGFDGIS